MTAKFSANADGTKVTIGNAAEDALQIDSTAKTIKAVAPYTMTPGPLAGLSLASVPSGGITVPSPIVAPKRITFNVTLLSNTGTGLPTLRLGTSAGIANTGYSSNYANMAHTAQGYVGYDTTGFSVATNLAAQNLQGVFRLEEIDEATNTWACTFQGTSSSSVMSWQFGTLTLPGPVTQIALVPSTGAFDSGSYSVRWEK